MDTVRNRWWLLAVMKYKCVSNAKTFYEFR